MCRYRLALFGIEFLLALLLPASAEGQLLPEPAGDYVKRFDQNYPSTQAEALCQLDIIKLQLALRWRDEGITVRTAQTQLFGRSYEEYFDLRIYFQRLIAEVYRYPAVAIRYVKSGRAYDDCVSIRLGY